MKSNYVNHESFKWVLVINIYSWINTFIYMFWIYVDFNFGSKLSIVGVAHLFNVLCCPIMCLYVLCSGLWCPSQFPLKKIFGSSLLIVVCRRSYLCFMCLIAYIGVQRILCCVFVLFVLVYVVSLSGLSTFYCPFGIL